MPKTDDLETLDENRFTKNKSIITALFVGLVT